MEFRRVFTDTPWEAKVGYCRALRAGDQVFVTGCAPVGRQGGVHAPGDAQAQAARCLEIVAEALAGVGAALSDVTRTRLFVTDISRWEEFGRAHAAVFTAHPPTTPMVEVRRLIDPAMLIEIEADAVVLRAEPHGGRTSSASALRVTPGRVACHARPYPGTVARYRSAASSPRAASAPRTRRGSA